MPPMATYTCAPSAVACSVSVQAGSMGKGFYVSKAVGIVLVIVGAAALATIIALSVVYSQEKAKNTQVSPTDGGPTSKPPVTTPTPSNEPWDKYRLPKSLMPHYYNLTLWPRLTEDPNTKLYIFTGESTVEFECLEDTNLILIHSNRLNYTTLTNGQLALLSAVSSGVEAPTITTSRLQTVTQYLVLQLDRNLVKGQLYRVYTKFTGELADDLGGFYRSEYEEDGVRKVVATTQMQPTDARKAFPCFDEPAMKATFDISLIHDPGTVALSNGRELETTNINMEGKNLHKTVFERTEKMSTYLLAFIVSDYDFINSTIDDVLIRIYARKPAIAAGQGAYALNKTGPILKFFEKYYNSSYPLPKSDQIALPDFNAGAMENWGLITYRETALLYDEAFSSNSNKERIATIIAHELAHMWFGNLVTLRWWNDLWLNEGFASYVEYLGAHEAEPDWNVKELIVLGDVQRVFAVDALASSHPLSSKEEDIQKPAQISELFDAISYSKGASVLRMLSDFLTEEVFTKGLQTYLAEFAFGNAVYTDLWKHLQMAVDATGTDLPASVHDIMNTWVLQMGFPVVTVNTQSGEVSQQHFLLDPDSNVTTESPFGYQWIVPIRWMKSGMVQSQKWLEVKSNTFAEMKVSGEDWLLANLNTVGYYRVNYDAANWDRLLKVLRTNHSAILRINRAQLMDDAFNLARAKVIPTVLALNTTKYLISERDYMPWKSALNNLDFFYLMFDRSEVYGYMQDYLRKQVTPLFQYYKTMTGNWSKVPEGHMDQYNQVDAISLACRTGLKECQDLVQSWFKQWMDTDTNTIHPNLRSTVYCNAIAAGGTVEWNFAWKKFKEASIATEAEKLRAALACTTQPWLLNRYLEYTLEPTMIRKQDATSTIVYIASNVIGQSLAWDFVRARWSYIFTQYGGGSFSFSNLINGVTKRFASEFELQQLRQFKADNAEVGFGSGTLAVDQSIERTVANIKWIAENRDNVLNWFKDANKEPGL
ncbi:aminopeptidase N-like [Parambassis ranga]|uniref:Aminopeptidase n=1 Tax=Parambassis ranga TaxID=210632 RepID=A0A6P7KCA8_9TELE|nr:aminopeptidase N-like [Parambassis ranga]